ncbi:MFS transporter [Nonomuraea angiospora]|uniref:MFS transporter n=1 Tax=Nonomuraea angiospora TaxID=46172 RepID=UPI003404738D
MNAAGSPRHRFWGLLASRDFRLLWLGETISKAGSSVSVVALPLVAVMELNAGPLAVGLITTTVWLPWLIFGLPVGVWVGRLPRRKVMVVCNLVSTAMLASIPAAAWLGVLTMAHLLTVALVTGIAAVFFMAAYQVYLPELVAPGDLIEGNAKLQGSASAAQVAGPGIAGAMAQWLGAVTGLLADAVTFVVSTVTLLLIRTPRAPQPDPPVRRSLRAEAAEGLAYIVRDPYLRALTAYGAAANLALVGYQSILVLFLLRDVGVSPGAVGALAATGAVGGVVGAGVAKTISRRFGTARGALTGQLLASLFGLLIPLAAPGPMLVFFVIGTLVLIAGVVACNVIFSSFRQTYSPPRLLSRIVTSSMVINHSTIPLGGLLGGVLGSAIGLRPTMWVMTVFLVLCGVILLASPLRRSRDLPVGVGEMNGLAKDADRART